MVLTTLVSEIDVEYMWRRCAETIVLGMVGGITLIATSLFLSSHPSAIHAFHRIFPATLSPFAHGLE